MLFRVKHDIRFTGNRLPVSIPIYRRKKGRSCRTIFIGHFPIRDFVTGQIKLPEIAVKITGKNEIHNIIKINVNCNGAGEPVIGTLTRFEFCK